MFSLFTPSMIISEPAPELTQDHDEAYLNAALADGLSFTLPTASMPTLQFSFKDDPR